MFQKNFLLFFLFNIILIYAQENTICVNYNITIENETDLFKSTPILRPFFLASLGTSKSVKFKLIANKSDSKFKIIDYVEIDSDKSVDMFICNIAGYFGDIFEYKDSIYKKDDNLAVNKYEKSAKIANWVLETESKVIDNNLCYKATNIKIVKNSVGEFKFPVIAWYCPKIPISSGPNGYGNLPGLILELQVRNVIFGASQITLNCEETISNEFLENVKTITPEERQEIYQKMD